MSILHCDSDLPVSYNFLYSRNGYIFVDKTARTSMTGDMACYALCYAQVLAYLLNLLVIMTITAEIEKIFKIIPMSG